VRELLALEPAPQMIAMARPLADSAAVPVTLIEASAEAIPIDDNSVDTVVMTWTLCSIPKAIDAVAEMRRVLRPGGRLVFVEHGLAPDDGVRWWQDRLTPAWRCVSGGCHLNRPIRSMIEAGGFSVDRLETGYMPGPKPMAFIYEGSALPK
jgi:SAM-dependent methyltransferase